MAEVTLVLLREVTRVRLLEVVVFVDAWVVGGVGGGSGCMIDRCACVYVCVCMYTHVHIVIRTSTHCHTNLE